MADTLEAQAKQLGIPMQVVVDDGLRYSYCAAHTATLASIEGTRAVYSGECANRHKYEMTYEIHELQQKAQIVNGEIVVGEGKGYKAQDLEEY